MRRALLASICAAVALSGCVSESADLGEPPPVVLETATRVVVAPPYSSRSAAAGRNRLRREVYAMANGNLQGLRAHIRARTLGEAETVGRILLGFGMDPARLSVEQAPRGQRAPEVILSRTLAGTAPCVEAIQPAYPDNPLPSLMSLAHCNQTNNLATMVVDSADLVAPPALAHQDGAYLAAGVRSWRANHSAALSPPDSSSASGNTGYNTGTPSTSAAQPTLAAPAVNSIPAGQTVATQ